MRLYVGNLSFDTTNEELRAAFEAFGTVTDAQIVTDRNTGRSRGFAFVTLSSATEGEAAINGMNGKSLHGRNLTVNEARPRDSRPGGGGGGGYRSRDNNRPSGGGGRGGGWKRGGGGPRGPRGDRESRTSSPESGYSESESDYSS